MKKLSSQTVKVITATAIASSAYVAVTPAQADAAASVTELVQKASAHIPILRSVSSVEYGANVAGRQPFNEYNRAKADYNTALAAVNKLPHSNQKIVLSERLNDVKLLLNRTGHFIDALTAGKKLTSYTEQLNELIALGDTSTAVTVYHRLTSELNKQAIMLYRVYGKSTRDAILDYYKQPAEEAKANALYPVSVHIEIERLIQAFETGNMEEAEKRMNNIEEWLGYIPEAEENAFQALQSWYYEVYNLYLYGITDIVVYDEAHLVTGDPALTLLDILTVQYSDNTEGPLSELEGGSEFYTFKDNKGYFNEDGTLAAAYAHTGLTETGTVIVEVFNKGTGEQLLTLTLEVK